MTGFGQLAQLLADGLDPRPDAVPTHAWVAARLGEHLWSKQRDVADSVDVNRYTAVPSCHGAGKSHTASRIIARFLERYPPGEAFAVTTAPTFPQVRAILWRYIGQAHRKGGLIGRVNQTEWHVGSELVAYGRKPSDYDESAFQGIHARRVLVVVDEAGGVPRQLWDAVESLVTNDDSRVLAIGNPDNPQSHFRELCQPGSGYNVVRISAFDTPNMTGEWVPPDVAAMLVSQRWVDERRERWGEGSPLWQAKVLAEFPDDTEDGVIPWSWLAACRDNPPADEADEPRRLGVDVGAGGDESVMALRVGLRVSVVQRDRVPDTMRTAETAARRASEHGVRTINVDSIGIGKGVADRLRQLRREGWHDAEVVEVNVGRPAREGRRFPRLRDELWWVVGRELSETRGWDLSDLDDDALTQLAAPSYSIDASGRVKVEPKDETRKRLGRSPDVADAVLLSSYQGKTARAVAGPRW